MAEELGSGKIKPEEMLSDKQRGATEVEDEKPVERKRTRESEITANVEFWRDLGIKVDEADVRREIEKIPEVEGFDWYIYMPEGVKATDLLSKIQKPGIPDYIDPEEIGSVRKSYAIATRYQQEPDQETLGDYYDRNKTPIYYQNQTKKNGQYYMSIGERLAAELRWRGNGRSHLDEKNFTVCPNSVYGTGILCVGFRREKWASAPHRETVWSHHPTVCIDAITFWDTGPNFGVRRVITQNSRIGEESATENPSRGWKFWKK